MKYSVNHRYTITGFLNSSAELIIFRMRLALTFLFCQVLSVWAAREWLETNKKTSQTRLFKQVWHVGLPSKSRMDILHVDFIKSALRRKSFSLSFTILLLCISWNNKAASLILNLKMQMAKKMLSEMFLQQKENTHKLLELHHEKN